MLIFKYLHIYTLLCVVYACTENISFFTATWSSQIKIVVATSTSWTMAFQECRSLALMIRLLTFTHHRSLGRRQIATSPPPVRSSPPPVRSSPPPVRSSPPPVRSSPPPIRSLSSPSSPGWIGDRGKTVHRHFGS